MVESPFENLIEIPDEPAVYALSLNRFTDRIRGKTDIIYIGMTGDLRNRMSEYGGKWIKDGGTGHRISDTIKRLNEALKLLYKLEKDLKAPRKGTEKQLLSAFLQEHHELPAWNRSGPNSILDV